MKKEADQARFEVSRTRPRCGSAPTLLTQNLVLPVAVTAQPANERTIVQLDNANAD